MMAVALVVGGLISLVGFVPGVYMLATGDVSVLHGYHYVNVAPADIPALATGGGVSDRACVRVRRASPGTWRERRGQGVCVGRDARPDGGRPRRGNGWRVAALVTLLIALVLGLGACLVHVLLVVAGAYARVAPLDAVGGWALVFGIPFALLAAGLYLLLRWGAVVCLVVGAVLLVIWLVRRRG